MTDRERFTDWMDKHRGAEWWEARYLLEVAAMDFLAAGRAEVQARMDSLQLQYDASQEALREVLNEHADFQARIDAAPVAWFSPIDGDAYTLVGLLFYARSPNAERRVRIVDDPVPVETKEAPSDPDSQG